MNFLQGLACANCGAGLRTDAAAGAVVVCDYCGTAFRIPASLTPEPEMGDLLLGADFRDPDVPGWQVFNRDKLDFRAGPPPELWVNFTASELIHPLLRTPGPLEDFDIGVSLRFVEGSFEYVSAGLEVRSGEGDYTVRVSAQGTYSVGWHKGNEWGGWLVNWTDHPALRRTMGSANRLRVWMAGDRLRVYLNGVLATSLRDSQFRFGFIRVIVSPSAHAPAVVAYSDLQIRDVRV